MCFLSVFVVRTNTDFIFTTYYFCMFKETINQKYSIREVWSLCFGYPLPEERYFVLFTRTYIRQQQKYDYGMRCFGVCNRVYTSYDFLKAFRPDIIEHEKKQLHPQNQIVHRDKVKSPVFRGSTDQVLEAIFNYLCHDTKV